MPFRNQNEAPPYHDEPSEGRVNNGLSPDQERVNGQESSIKFDPIDSSRKGMEREQYRQQLKRSLMTYLHYLDDNLDSVGAADAQHLLLGLTIARGKTENLPTLYLLRHEKSSYR